MMASPIKPAKNRFGAILKQGVGAFPRRHLMTIGILCSGLLLVLAINIPPKEEKAKRQSQSLTLSLSDGQRLPASQHVTQAQESKPDLSDKPGLTEELQELLPNDAEPMAPEIIPTVEWSKERVRTGDSLSLIFQRAGLSDRDLFEFMAGNAASKTLTRIHPGHELEFHIEDKQLLGLRYRRDRLSSELFTRSGADKFDHEVEQRQPDIHHAYIETSINDSLFLAGQKANMDANLIMELASIFGWDIDFGLDIRRGDSFKVLFEERYLDGEKIGNGNILAAEFTNQNETYRAVIYEDSKGASHFFTPEGKSMRKAFLRAPVDFRRISSNFNPNRLHPIHKTARPHRGTDYAASRGTPVWSSGDGRVITSTYNKASGNYVVIQHGNNIQTKYLHLSKRSVKVGQRVKQKQVIGLVGSTGYSTGPHLHYEFLLDGVHRNPRTILDKLPKTKSIPDAEMARFTEATKPILASLDNHHQQFLLAKTGEE